MMTTSRFEAMILSLVVAMAKSRVIGRNNNLPWHLPSDLRYFKRITMGKPIVMGRKTHESIGRPLPGRGNIVISRNPVYAAPGCIVAHSVEEALAAAAPAEEVMLIGGASLFEQTLSRADRIYLTEVTAELQGDAWFPLIDAQRWREVWREDHSADDENPYAHSFFLLAAAP